MTTITTERMKIVKTIGWTNPHINTMVRWLNDPEVVRYSEQRHQQHDWESQIQYVENVDLFREIHAADKFIGTIVAHIDEPNSVADVGILIGEKSEWGKGYGFEAWKAFCDHLLDNGIRKIEAGCMSMNLGMSRIFRKYKMNYEGTREDHFLFENMTVDMDYWGKFK